MRVCSKCGSNDVELKMVNGFDKVFCKKCGNVTFLMGKTILTKQVQINWDYPLRTNKSTPKSSTSRKNKSKLIPVQYDFTVESKKKKQKRNNTITGAEVILKNELASKHVNIHLPGTEELKDYAPIMDRMRKDYPEIVTEQMSAVNLLQKAFPSGLQQRCVIRNQTYEEKNRKGEVFLVPRVDLYIVSSNQFGSKLGQNQVLLFSGKIRQGEFCIDDVRVVDNPVKKNDDIETDVIFHLGRDGEKRSNYLKDVTASLSPSIIQREREIKAWNEYLDWKNELANLRIQALKYIGFSIEIGNRSRRISFLTVFDNPETLDKFTKYLRRNEVSVFSNYYSSDRFQFRFNTENVQEYETGIYLEFQEMGRPFLIDEIRKTKWMSSRRHSKQYRRGKAEKYQDVRFDELLEQVKRELGQDTQCVEISFSLSESANETMRQQIKQNGFLSDDIEDLLAEEFYYDGFIATSQVGEFALIRRLKKAIADYISGKSVSQGLEQWLFDIRKARPITEMIMIKKWQNCNLNDNQKQAVQKIVSAPDVCLIQGPPGTGKTTVIAEAIYQFVIQHKRVLVASQANLAVDNALERLIQNPRIRAIRLGNSRKFDSAVRNITEENVLANFYNTIVEYIDTEYINKWAQSEKLLNDLTDDLNSVSRHLAALHSLDAEKKRYERQLYEISGDFDTDGVKNSIRMLDENLTSCSVLTDFCMGRTDDYSIPDGTVFMEDVRNSTSDLIEALENNGIRVRKENRDGFQSNTAFNLTLSRVSMALALIPKLESTNDLEIEKLKLKEKELLNSLANDVSVYEEWKKIRKQIDLLCKDSKNITFSAEEEGLFSIEILRISEPGERNKCILNLLLNNKKTLEQILDISYRVATDMAQEFSIKKNNLQKLLDEYEQNTYSVRQDIQTIIGAMKDKEEALATICDKYEQKQDSIKSYLEGQIEKLRNELYGIASREDWEPVFAGFKDWIKKIPDYRNEKSIYLDSYINGCNVVGVSCTENTRTLKENGFDDFDVVIIDEVSKATPPELLIPMMKGKKVVLVGDHRQLPPLFNEHENSYQEVIELQSEYGEEVSVELKPSDFEKYRNMVTSSLFQQYFEAADSSIKETLTNQYRMHGDIMQIVNKFYDGLLVDGNAVAKNGNDKSHGIEIESCLGTDMICPSKHAYWIDSSRLAEQRVFEHRSRGSKSAANLIEACIIKELLEKIELQYANSAESNGRPVSVGVISFYYEQVTLIRKMLQPVSFHAIDVEINTVDRFQGKEKEIVLVSLVRNSQRVRHSTNSFIAAYQRINVAFSRAQNLLVIIGAKDMYVDQPVVITDLNNGAECTRMVYKEIIENLNMKGAFFSADEVIPELTAQAIIDEYRKTIGGLGK